MIHIQFPPSVLENLLYIACVSCALVYWKSTDQSSCACRRTFHQNDHYAPVPSNVMSESCYYSGFVMVQNVSVGGAGLVVYDPNWGDGDEHQNGSHVVV
jgi:hypothetical protein